MTAPEPGRADNDCGVGASPETVDLWLDERGLRCPLPVISLNRAAASSAAGRVIAVLADDPAAAYDIPAWCRLKGFTYLGAEPAADHGTGDAYFIALTPSPMSLPPASMGQAD